MVVMSLAAQTGRARSDEELVSRYQLTGDPEYFAQVFARNRTLVFAACRRFFGNGSLAEDATQETFLRAYKNIHQFREGNVCGWLMRIAKNVCIDLWRKQRPELEAVEAGSIDPSGICNLDHLTAMTHAMKRVQEEMKSLAPAQRRCLEMKMEGFSYEETAERTGLSVGEVKSHLQNGRRMLWMRVEGILSELL
jgi:RNA polymerase sigma-70 factor, ECF subfamily